VSEIAARVGCKWHTAKTDIAGYQTVKEAWEAERSRITDIAESNVIEAIKGRDLSMSKWWLQVMRDEFNSPQKQEVTGKGGAPLFTDGSIRVIVHGDGE